MGILSRSTLGNWVTYNDEAFETCSEENRTAQETLIQVSGVRCYLIIRCSAIKCMWSSSDNLMRNTEVMIMRSLTCFEISSESLEETRLLCFSQEKRILSYWRLS